MEKLISDNTIYYLFSTIAQVMAAISALLAIFIQFKIAELKEFLVGDGLAVYNRKVNYDNSNGSINKGYGLMSEKLKERLYDANARKDLYNIEKIFLELSEKEKANNETHPTGFGGLYKRFIEMKVDRQKLISSTKISVFLSIFTILISLIVLSFFDCIKNCDVIKIMLLLTILILSIFTLGFVIYGIYLGLREKVYAFEKLD